MPGLISRFSRSHLQLQANVPVIQSLVDGFSLCIHRQEGCLFQHKEPNHPPVCPSEHFVIEVSYDGQNPLYRTTERGVVATVKVTRLSTISPGGIHFNRGYLGIPLAAALRKVTVEEETRKNRVRSERLFANRSSFFTHLCLHLSKGSRQPTRIGIAQQS